MLLYVDTNIIMDFLLNRDSSAYRVLMDGYLCNHEFIISELVIKELKYQRMQPETFLMLSKQTGKLTIVPVTQKFSTYAKHQQHTHFNDAIHAAAALQHTQGAILTKNIKDFIDVPGITAIHPDNI